MEWNLADIWESVADALPDHVALVQGERRVTWGQFDDRASRLAGALTAAGLRPGSKVASYLYNSNEYSEGVYATFKIRCVPVNVNYRYLEDELAYLIDNSDAEALLFHGELGDRVAKIREQAPHVKAWIQIDDGAPRQEFAVEYEELLAAHDPMPRIERSDDDLYFLYTGGTTGMPKGVMWRNEDLIKVLIDSAYQFAGVLPPDTPAGSGAIAKAVIDGGSKRMHLPASPLMHGTGAFTSFQAMFVGTGIVTLENRHFDAHELWQTVQRERITSLAIVGDAFAKPMVRALEEAEAKGAPYDISSVQIIISSGVMWSTETKQALMSRGNIICYDSLGSSEVVAGSDEIGMLAVGGHIPVGYYKDKAKSDSTFRVINGTRWSVPGDFARVEADGSIVLLGRGSACINSGGEKVYPEEVEEAVKAHADVADCLVVGVPDERFGEAVTAVVARRAGSSVSDTEISAALDALARYKRPRRFVFVPEIKRGPNGKADYKWAKQEAAAVPAAE